MTMSNPRQASLQQQQSQRLKAFRTLLDPTDRLPGHNVADLYSLRHLCLQGGGIPDTASSSSHGWLRAQAWRVLLGYLSPEKSEWNDILEKRRAEYYQFAQDFLPQHASSSKNTLPGKLSERDALLDQIYRDLSRSRKNAFAFYREEVKPSRSCPLAPAPAGGEKASFKERIDGRHSFLQRLETINDDFAYAMREERKASSPAIFSTPKKSRETLLPVTAANGSHQNSLSPSITLEPASPGSNLVTTPGSGVSDGDSYFASADEGEASAHSEASTYTDRRWHSLLRILYIYALLNPSIGYVQGMNEVLFVLLYVMGTSGPLPSATGPPVPAKEGQTEEDFSSSFQYLEREEGEAGTHAEADAFWCFSALVGDVRELYDFEGMESAGLQITNARPSEGSSSITGMAAALKRFSLRLKWLDEGLWKQMRRHSLDPRLPYYSFRWLACMVSTELTLPSVLRIWDAILSESTASSGAEASPKIDFLIDVCCSLLINVREPILSSLDGNDEDLSDNETPDQDSFGRAMKVLQNLPDDDVEPIVEMACLHRQRRLAAPLTGDAPASEDEDDSLLSVRDRAANALRTWTTATPSRKPKWLTSSPRTPSALPSPGEEGTRSTSAALLRRYTSAMQSSDAAASLSKASTNLTAKAMATWSGSRGRSSTSSSTGSPFAKGANGDHQEAHHEASPFSDLKASIVNRVMSATTPSSTTSDETGSVHPSLRWSVLGAPPDLPVPDVNDSPPGRTETTLHATPARGFASVNRLGSMSVAMQSADSPLSPELAYADSTPGTSPVSASISKFGGTPSLQTTPRTQARGAGPKPLLLTGSARPPRERSPSGSLAGDDVSSRKVSSGPLAANVHSPQQNNFSRRRRKASYRGGDSSYAGSVASSAAGADSASNETTEEDSLATADAVPLLPSLQAAAKLASPMVPPKTVAVAPPLGLQGSGLGTVPASAFSKVRAASYGTSSDIAGEEEAKDRKKPTSRPAFGQVASSADVPLSTKVTLQRKPKRTSSGQIVLFSPEEDQQQQQQHASNGLYSRRSGSKGAIDPSNNEEQGDPVEARGAEPRRYTLTDEPTTFSSPPLGSRPSAVERRESSSSTRSSGAGIVRSRRAYSGAAKRTSSSRQSLSHLSEAAAKEGEEQAAATTTLTTRGGSESLRLGTIETGSFALDFSDVQGKATTDTPSEASAAAPTPQPPPPAVMTPQLPSPGGVLDGGKVLGAEELLDRLQLDQGYSGGESSGFEEDVVLRPTRRAVVGARESGSSGRKADFI